MVIPALSPAVKEDNCEQFAVGITIECIIDSEYNNVIICTYIVVHVLQFIH